MSEHGACFVFFILSDRLDYVGKTRWPHLDFPFSKRKTNDICVLIRLFALLIVTTTSRIDHVCLGLWKLGQCLKILYTQLICDTTLYYI